MNQDHSHRHCADRDTLLALLAGRGTVAPEVRSHVDECASCRAALGRLLGVFYVAAADEAFRSGASPADDCRLSSDKLRVIFQSVDSVYRRRFGQNAEQETRQLEELRRMVSLATKSTAPSDAIPALPSGLAESIFQNVDREYQRRFAAPPPAVESPSVGPTAWSRPVRWATAAALLVTVGVGVLTSVDYFSNRGDLVVVESGPETVPLAEDKQHRRGQHDEPAETPGVVLSDQDLQRLAALRRQRLEWARQQSLAFLRQRFSDTVAVVRRLSSLGDDWRRYPDDTLLRARRAILEQDYEVADFWLQKRLLAIDLGVITEPRIPVLLVRLECRRRQIEWARSAPAPASPRDVAQRDFSQRDSAQRDFSQKDFSQKDSAQRDSAQRDAAERFGKLMEIYVELDRQINRPQMEWSAKNDGYRDRLHREALRIAHLASDARRSAMVVTLLEPRRETLDAGARGMLVTARRDINRQVDRLVGTGQLAATHKVESWIRSRYLQISAIVEPGS